MDRQYREQHRIDTLRSRRRSCLIIAGFAGFLTALYFTSDPDDTLTLAIALVFYFVTVLLVPDRWFGSDRLDESDRSPPPDGPLPAVRSQPPPAPTRGNTRHDPPRYGPIPPPPRPRQR